MRTSWISLFAMALFCWMPVKAQTTEDPYLPASLCAQIVHPFQLNVSATSFSDSIWVSKSSSMHLAVLLPDGDFSISLMSPSGTVIPWDPASVAASCRKVVAQSDPNGPILGNAYHFVLDSPTSGRWTLNAQAAAPLQSVWGSGIVNVDFVSSINAGLFMATHETFFGRSLSASLAVMDGATMRTDFQYTAKLYRGGDPISSAQSVSFTSVPSSIGGDPTLMATLQPTQSGSYNLVVNISGTTSDGTFERTVATGFIVYPQKARITGTFTQRTEISFPKSGF